MVLSSSSWLIVCISILIFLAILKLIDYNKSKKLNQFLIAFDKCADYYKSDLKNYEIAYHLNNDFIKAFNNLGKSKELKEICLFCTSIIAFANMPGDNRDLFRTSFYSIFENEKCKNKFEKYCEVFNPSIDKVEIYFKFYQMFFTYKIKKVILYSFCED